MRGIFRKLRRDERGVAIIWTLLFIPVLLFAMGYAVQQTQAVTGADINLQGAVNSAVKAAAGMVTDDSQAAGEPRINTALAHAMFRHELAENLGLDELTFEPLSGSLISEKPEYTLIVYNGDDTYSPGGALGSYMYDFRSGSLTESPLPVNRFPQTFGLTSDSIVYGSGEVEVTLENPGVIAVVTAKQVKMFDTGDEELEIARWGCARVVY